MVYTQGTGTIDALVNAVTSWKLAMDDTNTLAVHALFEDFSKAFDNMRPDIQTSCYPKDTVNQLLPGVSTT